MSTLPSDRSVLIWEYYLAQSAPKPSFTQVGEAFGVTRCVVAGIVWRMKNAAAKAPKA